LKNVIIENKDVKTSLVFFCRITHLGLLLRSFGAFSLANVLVSISLQDGSSDIGTSQITKSSWDVFRQSSTTIINQKVIFVSSEILPDRSVFVLINWEVNQSLETVYLARCYIHIYDQICYVFHADFLQPRLQILEKACLQPAITSAGLKQRHDSNLTSFSCLCHWVFSIDVPRWW